MADGRVDYKLRTLQRRLDLLCGQGRLVAQGKGRARRYLAAASAPANDQLLPATDLDWLSAEAREIRALITRPLSKRRPVVYDAAFLTRASRPA